MYRIIVDLFCGLFLHVDPGGVQKSELVLDGCRHFPALGACIEQGAKTCSFHFGSMQLSPNMSQPCFSHFWELEAGVASADFVAATR